MSVSQGFPIVVLANVSHILWKEYRIVIDFFGRSEVPFHNILCDLYEVKVWEAMVQNSMSCHAIPKRWACSCFGVPCSPHIYVYERVWFKSCGRNHVGTEILMTLSQPMKNFDFGN